MTAFAACPKCGCYGHGPWPGPVDKLRTGITEALSALRNNNPAQAFMILERVKKAK